MWTLFATVVRSPWHYTLIADRTPLTSRHRTAAVLAVLAGLLATGVTTGAGTAAAATRFAVTSRSPIVGDVTGDGLRDKTVLGRMVDTGVCAAQITRGVAGGGYATTATTLRLPVRTDGTPTGCPDLGVALRGPVPSANRLAVTFFGGPGYATPSVQVFGLVTGAAVYRTGFDGQYQPATIGTQDFDGDGYGDVWEGTDQGDGFTAYRVRATSTAPLYATPTTAMADSRFLSLDRGPGTDVLVTTDAYPSYNASAVAVDGRTGATRVLAEQTDGSVLGYRITTVDIDHDAYPDLRVESVPDAGSGLAPTVQFFLNRSQGGRFAFVATPTGPTS